MHLRKQRSLTPGPVPLYPGPLRAMNLKRQRKNAASGESSRTPKTALAPGLGEALNCVKQIGIHKLFAPNSSAAPVTAARVLRGMDSGVIVKETKGRFGAIIANGQGSPKGLIFRIAHLGYFDFAGLFSVIAEPALILAVNGHPVKFGRGLAAVRNVYTEGALPCAVAV